MYRLVSGIALPAHLHIDTRWPGIGTQVRTRGKDSVGIGDSELTCSSDNFHGVATRCCSWRHSYCSWYQTSEAVCSSRCYRSRAIVPENIDSFESYEAVGTH